MDSELKRKAKCRARRKKRVRNHVRGTQEKPRLSIIKTNQHLHVQLIDDVSGQTIASVSTISKEFRNSEFSRKNKASAKHLGQALATLAKKKEITQVVVDRGASKYHGVVAALADGVREGGLVL